MNDLIGIVVGAIVGVLVWRCWIRQRRRLQRWWQHQTAKLPRQWKPHAAQACAACRAGLHVSVVRRTPKVEPYTSGKNKPGRPKRLETAGYACPGPTCRYFGVTDAAVHALVGYGTLDGQHPIQRWRCQACGTTFSCRRGTPLYYLKSALSEVELVLWFLAEGVDRSVLVRYTGRHEATVSRWLERAGRQSAR